MKHSLLVAALLAIPAFSQIPAYTPVPQSPFGEMTLTTLKACNVAVNPNDPLRPKSFCLFAYAKTTRTDVRYFHFTATQKTADGGLAFASMSAPASTTAGQPSSVVFPLYDRILTIDVQQISEDGRILSQDRYYVDP